MAVPHRLGYAKVALGSLRFIDCLNREDGQEQALPQLDERNVTRLESIFRLAGPSRGEKRNFIRAVAQRSAVQDRLTPEIPTADDVIAVGLPLRCLRGKHRAEAGTRTLAAADQWWVVEVFDEGKTDT